MILMENELEVNTNKWNETKKTNNNDNETSSESKEMGSE